MEKFVNEGFNEAICNYLDSKDNTESVLFNSALVVFIRLLINIYGELDIINPFRCKDEKSLDINLMKFGASIQEINKLKTLFNDFYNKDLLKENIEFEFIEIQKCIIDLFTLKRINFGIDNSNQKEFFDLLYTPGTSNVLRISYNFKCAKNIYEIAEYYNEKLKIPVNNKNEDKPLIGFNVYKKFNVSISDLSKMNKEEIENLNKQIYNYYDIDENSINKDYLLQEKLKNLYKNNQLLTTGNGYVDILIIMSVIITAIMIIIIVSILIS